MRKLKIAYLSCGSFTHIGPYIEFFKSRGHDITLIAYDTPNRDYGVKVIDISRGACGKEAGSKWKYLLAGMSLKKIIKELRPDILHGHYVTSAGVIGMLSGFKPLVLTAHGSDVIGSMPSKLWRMILKCVFAKAAYINPVSERLAEHIRTLGIPNDKIVVATLGVDTDIYTCKPFEEFHRPLRLLCTRTLADVYDPMTIIKAAKVLKAKGVDFTITFAAGGDMEEQLKDVSAQQGVRDKIRFMGGYNNNQLPALLHEHDIFVSASLWDGTSISLLEAMAAGIYPIVSRIPANTAWLDEGVTGSMHAVGNSDELAGAIIEAMRKPDHIATAIKANRDRVVEKGGRTRNMEKIEAIYYKLIKT